MSAECLATLGYLPVEIREPFLSYRVPVGRPQALRDLTLNPTRCSAIACVKSRRALIRELFTGIWQYRRVPSTTLNDTSQYLLPTDLHSCFNTAFASFFPQLRNKEAKPGPPAHLIVLAQVFGVLWGFFLYRTRNKEMAFATTNNSDSRQRVGSVAASALGAGAGEPLTPSSSGKRGAFIVLEGLDRSGKTTQVKLLQTRFVEAGKEVRAMRFPGEFSFLSRLPCCQRCVEDFGKNVGMKKRANGRETR